MIELYVENSSVDVDKAFSVMLTMAIDDIKDFAAKNTTFSKTIILPGTANNNKLFGNIFDITTGNTYDATQQNKGINFNAAISARAYIFADNIQIFKGVFRILEIIIDKDFIEYECSVTGELGGFVSKLGANKLEQLNFAEYNHDFTVANIVTSWTTAGAGSGYCYPLIDYGTYSTNKIDWRIGTFRPALYVKEYIDKIFAASGYTYNCDLFNTARFKGLVVPYNRKELTRLTNQSLDISGDSSISLTGAGIVEDYLKYLTHTILGSFTIDATDKILTYTSASSAVLDFDAQFNYDLDNNFGTPPIANAQIVINGNPIALQMLSTGTNNSCRLQASQVTVNTGDIIQVKFQCLGNLFTSTNLNVYNSRFQISSIIPTQVIVAVGDAIDLNNLLPKNILQKDFISSICKLFNLYVFEDLNNDKLLYIKPFVDFYANATVIDWTAKIDRSHPFRIKPMSELNSRYYEFKFKDDTDYYNDLYKKRYNESYGAYKFDSEYEFSKDKTTVELIFSPTPLVGYAGSDKVYSTIFKKSATNEELIDSNIRILQTKYITGVASWKIRNSDNTATLGTYTEYLYAGHYDSPDLPTNDIQFGVPKELFFTLASGALNINQFNVYWSSYMAEITDKDSKLLTATFKLDYKDIYNLDFSKLIYIDGSLFRINKIEDFNASNEDTCKIELLKVINRIY